MIKLTDEQQAAVDTLAAMRQDVQTLGGYAGTGKTTVIRALTERLKNAAVCAYTGKAAQVLRKNGVPASTIHSLIYKVVAEEDDGPVEFVLKHPDEMLCQEIVIDEGSMVPEPIFDDLRSFGLPLIFVGDHGQLEPVGAGSFNLMESPQITLTKIHRNAGEIAMFADHLRKGHDARSWDGGDAETRAVSKIEVVNNDELDTVQGITEESQMICAYNRTRIGLNAMIRKNFLNRDEAPCRGDKVICLQNDKRIHIFNGMQGIIESINHAMLTFRSDDLRVKVRYNPDAFGSERTPPWQRGVIPFDWAYCVTCHKAQGDEWDHVVAVEQRCGAWDHKRWAYTAASRAKTRLTWVLE